MKRLSILLTFILMFSLLAPINVQATNQYEKETIFFSDGSYIISEITVIQFRAGSAIGGNRHYDYYNANDVKQWRATVTGTFTYDGTTATCTSVSTNFVRYTTTWTLDSVSKSKSGATAIGDFYLSCSAWETSVRVQLTCDKNGNLS